MIQIVQEILAEQFKVAESQVHLLASEVHPDGVIYGFEISGLSEATFIYTQLANEEWKVANFQVYVPDLNTWIRMWRFPDDPYLPGLSMVAVKPALLTLLQKLDLKFEINSIQNVAYRPGKRAVFRITTNLVNLYAKVTTANNATRIMTIQSALPDSINKAEILGIANDDILFFRELQGQDFVSANSLNSEELAYQISEFQHTISKIHIDLPAKRKVITSLDWYLTILENRLDSELCEQIYNKLQKLPDVPVLKDESFIHGDLHLGQIKINDSKIALLDFDNAGMGDIAEDQSSMLASALFSCVVNLSNQTSDRYLAFVKSWARVLEKEAELVTIRALSSRHIVAFLASFPTLVEGKEAHFLHILDKMGQDDENLLILDSSVFQEPLQ